jgi:hypothetical protein
MRIWLFSPLQEDISRRLILVGFIQNNAVLSKKSAHAQ